MTSLRRSHLQPRRKAQSQRFNIIASICVLAFAGGGVAAVFNPGPAPQQAFAAGDITGSTSALQQLGPSGFPLPRFVVLKANKVNVRRGPSSDHGVAFVFQRKGLPVEITAEFENWRKIRDADGAEGWILQSMLTGIRNVTVADWAPDKLLSLRASPTNTSGITAQLQAGVLAKVESCDGQWCALDVEGHDGYADQSMLWGVYPGEVVD